ncbi:hypothetical protein [Allomuricauda sp. R78024]|uniref:Kelch repeat-containing protein n=1 Tax=Allomuricauda sp. R78024 TaxID=3093867 RepID=UPI0037C651FB
MLLSLIITTLSCSSDNKEDDSSEINSPPMEFNLGGIANNAINVDLLPTVSWNEAVDPENDVVSYSVLLDQNETPSTVIASDIDGISYNIDNTLDRCTTYYWQIVASDGNETTASEVFSFSTRNVSFSSPVVMENADFSIRFRQSGVIFKDRLWILAGFNPDNAYVNDVWSSDDGILWTEEATNPAFLGRQYHSTVVFDDKIWMIGGQLNGGESEVNSVWSSTDGATWTAENPVGESFSKRYGHTSVVFDNKIWVIGGFEYGSSTYKNDVWYTSDGVNWIEASAETSFLGRFTHTTLVFNNKMWVIGGRDLQRMNDVWSSIDGITWIEETANALFIERSSHSSVVFDDKMWVIGGVSMEGWKNDAWYSSDGVTWTQSVEDVVFAGTNRPTTVVFEDKIWIIAGSSAEGGILNTVGAFE